MRGLGLVGAVAVAAALGGLALAGCNSGSSTPVITGPTLAPTLPPASVIEYNIPTAASLPFGIAEGSNGNMWFSENATGKIGQVTPSGAINEVALPSGNSSEPEDIANGPNGDVWFVESGASKIGVIDPSDSELVAEYTTPSANAGPVGMASDPTNGDVMWFAEYNTGELCSVSGAGVIACYAITGTGVAPAPDDVTVTNNPNNSGTPAVWFLDVSNNAVGVMTFPGPTFTEYGIPTADSIPEFLTVGPDGNIWFTEGNTDNIGRLTITGTPSIEEVQTPSSAEIQTVPWGITVSPEDNEIWVAESNAGQVARVTTGFVITEYGIPADAAGEGTTAVDVAPGPDTSGGAAEDLWFTDGSVNGSVEGTDQVGKIQLADLGLSSSRKPLSELHVSKTHEIPLAHGMVVHRL
ncbi:MAG TPA: hypothetical protein VEJ20_05090 [Candidatus Eremiobacteraceae bacterium]|nr:hypothetical protein [Candidatus Eremiobacteraceae bacterium]